MLRRFLNLVTLLAPFQSRVDFLVALAAGDVSQAGAWLAMLSGATGFFEFAINPFLGRHRRRPSAAPVLPQSCPSPATVLP